MFCFVHPMLVGLVFAITRPDITDITVPVDWA